MPKELDVRKIELEKHTLVDAFPERETLAQFGELLEKFAALNMYQFTRFSRKEKSDGK